MVVREATTTTILDTLWNFPFLPFAIIVAVTLAATVLNCKTKQNLHPSNQQQISPPLLLNPPSKVLPYSPACRCWLPAVEECQTFPNSTKQAQLDMTMKPVPEGICPNPSRFWRGISELIGYGFGDYPTFTTRKVTFSDRNIFVTISVRTDSVTTCHRCCDQKYLSWLT